MFPTRDPVRLQQSQSTHHSVPVHPEEYACITCHKKRNNVGYPSITT